MIQNPFKKKPPRQTHNKSFVKCIHSYQDTVQASEHINATKRITAFAFHG